MDMLAGLMTYAIIALPTYLELCRGVFFDNYEFTLKLSYYLIVVSCRLLNAFLCEILCSDFVLNTLLMYIKNFKLLAFNFLQGL